MGVLSASFGHERLNTLAMKTVRGNDAPSAKACRPSPCNFAFSQHACASSTSGSTGPARSQSMIATARPSRTMFQGVMSRSPMTRGSLATVRPNHGYQAVSHGTRNEAVAVCIWRSNAPTDGAPSSVHGPGWTNSPSI
jgi:hypothetical protein